MAKKLVRLLSGSLDGENKVAEDRCSLDKPAMLVYEGEFESMDGPVTIKKEDIEKLAANHNGFLAKLSRLATGEVSLKHNPPIQLDHSTSARDTVGRLVGNLTVGEHTNEEGNKVPALFGTARVLGRENVEKVLDGRWTHLSGGFDLENHKVTELTITPFPAAADASLLSQRRLNEKPDGKTNGEEDAMPGYKDMKEKMGKYEKCKKHLMDKEKLSEEAVEDRLAGLTDDDIEKMSAEQDEHEKKLAAEAADKEAKEKEEKEAELKRMSALKEHKGKLVELSKGLKGTSAKVQLTAKKSAIRVRLSKLQAETKITPAEIKGINLDDLAGKSDEVINATLSSYEKREPVIDVGLYGSTKALSAAQLQAKVKKLGGEHLELKTRLSMPSKRADALKRLSELGLTEADLDKAVNVHIDNVPQGQHDVDHEAAYGELKRLLAEGKEDEAKAHFLKHVSYGAGSAPAEHLTTDATQDISSLADEVKKMQTNFEEVVKLAAPIFGATADELA